MRDVPMARHSLRSCRIVGESMAPTMKRGVHENRNEKLHGRRKIKKSFCASKMQSRSFTIPLKGLLAGGALHDGDHEGVDFVRQCAGERRVGNARPRLVSHCRRQSMVAAEYGSPPEIAGHAGAGVGLYDPRSAHGRPLTAADRARGRV
jgi:hypothetical protein